METNKVQQCENENHLWEVTNTESISSYESGGGGVGWNLVTRNIVYCVCKYCGMSKEIYNVSEDGPLGYA